MSPENSTRRTASNEPTTTNATIIVPAQRVDRANADSKKNQASTIPIEIAVKMAVSVTFRPRSSPSTGAIHKPAIKTVTTPTLVSGNQIRRGSRDTGMSEATRSP